MTDKRYPGSVTTWLRKEHQAAHGAKDVQCGDCFACCISGQPVTVLLADSRELLTTEGADGLRVLRQRDDGSCIHFEHGKCQVYDIRPHNCRSFDCRRYLFAGVESGWPAVAKAVQQWDLDAAIKTPADKAALAGIRRAVKMGYGR